MVGGVVGVGTTVVGTAVVDGAAVVDGVAVVDGAAVVLTLVTVATPAADDAADDNGVLRGTVVTLDAPAPPSHGTVSM